MSANPYQAPAADITTSADGVFDQSSPFSPKGRFGRLSYLAWAMVYGMTVGVLLAVVMGASLMSGSGAAFGGVMLVELIAMIPVVIFAIRRLHDFDAAGWWALLMIVPLANVIFWLALLLRAGDEGPNRFAPPRVTAGWEKVVGYIGIGCMVLAVVGIVAAILIPMMASH